MAEIEVSSKKNPRVDMTPMVDLGFLLITFFVFTTTFTQSNIMKLAMPDLSDGRHSIDKVDNTLTLILGKNNRLFWHQATNDNLVKASLNECNYSPKGVRQVVLDARKRSINAQNFTVIIKPTDESNYKNTVDILDEMAITASHRYAIVEPSSKEKDLCALLSK